MSMTLSSIAASTQTSANQATPQHQTVLSQSGSVALAKILKRELPKIPAFNRGTPLTKTDQITSLNNRLSIHVGPTVVTLLIEPPTIHRTINKREGLPAQVGESRRYIVLAGSDVLDRVLKSMPDNKKGFFTGLLSYVIPSFITNAIPKPFQPIKSVPNANLNSLDNPLWAFVDRQDSHIWSSKINRILQLQRTPRQEDIAELESFLIQEAKRMRYK